MCGYKEWWGRDAVNYISLLICTHTHTHRFTSTHARTNTHFIRLKLTAKTQTIEDERRKNWTSRGRKRSCRDARSHQQHSRGTRCVVLNAPIINSSIEQLLVARCVGFMVFTSRWPSSFPAVRFVFTAPKSKQMKSVSISDSREDKNKSCFQQTRAERGVNVSSSGGQKLKVNRQLIVNQPIVLFHWQEHTD